MVFQEYEGKMLEMRQEFEAMKMSKEKLQQEMSTLREHYNHDMASVEDGLVQSPGQSEYCSQSLAGVLTGAFGLYTKTLSNMESDCIPQQNGKAIPNQFCGRCTYRIFLSSTLYF